MTAQIVSKLLHLPTVRMKEAAVTSDGVVYADVVRHLFGLGRRSRRDPPISVGRPLPLRVPTAFVRIRPSTGSPVRRVAHRSEAPLCCFASARAAVGSR